MTIKKNLAQFHFVNLTQISSVLNFDKFYGVHLKFGQVALFVNL